MAKQTGIITLQGNVGRLNFFKNKDGFQAREKGGVSKSRIMTDPRYARTRENIAEFTTNAAVVKLLKDTIRPAIVRISDTRLHQRLVKKLLTILRTDAVNVRGQRNIQEGDWNLLIGMEINATVGLTSTLRPELVLINTGTDWGISIQPYQPSDFMVIPEGASHFKVFVAGASIDILTGNRSFQMEASANLPINVETPAINLAVEKALIPDPHRILIVGVEFMQEVNGQYYAMNNGANNAAVIIAVEKD
ncbi:hypothetical protein SAMN00777080_3073 [Aquiflexum balticum DSM 16537]|uniref:Uncharacterized protein n=1 Tax=Aquiflexum balticum DSM 16537 TaxID=758820 RepID=A0A1W2H732_9BACT|nr:hypothetical protein [Aquiflexum balticum]SMD44452.1 hypothetical protein SAMN00777080_3073 [Aquiflexum balticum DSM 16537]